MMSTNPSPMRIFFCFAAFFFAASFAAFGAMVAP
jgi:hypothetical protein